MQSSLSSSLSPMSAKLSSASGIHSYELAMTINAAKSTQAEITDAV